MSYKFNGGNGAILCDGCHTIIQSNISLSDYRKQHTGYDFCDKCLSNVKVVDNFDWALNFMEFKNQDEFYFIQIIQRKKDGNITQIGNNGYRTIKTYYIYSKEQLAMKANKIRELCLRNNARAYIHPNKRNAKEIALECIAWYAQLVKTNNSFQGYRVYDSMCGKHSAKDYKKLWIIDVDTKDMEIVQRYIKAADESRSDFDKNVLDVVPTLNGYHLISHGFNPLDFLQNIQELPKPDIQRDNPTLLYYAQ